MRYPGARVALRTKNPLTVNRSQALALNATKVLRSPRPFPPLGTAARRAYVFTFRDGFYNALELRRSQSVAFTTAVATTSLVMK